MTANNVTKNTLLPRIEPSENDLVEMAMAAPSCLVPYLWRDDGERFSRNNDDGTYTMGKNREAQPTCFYRYTFGRLMDTGVFSVYPPNAVGQHQE